MKTVWKFPLPLMNGDYPKILMPVGAEVLYVNIQHGILCLWALVDDKAGMEHRMFRLAGTGHELPDDGSLGKYVGSFQMMDDSLVFHVFEMKCPRTVIMDGPKSSVAPAAAVE